MMLACQLLPILFLSAELTSPQPLLARHTIDPPSESSPLTPNDAVASEVNRIFANWPYQVMTCKISSAPKPDVDPQTVPPNSSVSSGSKPIPNRVRYTVSVDIGLDDAKWQEWSQMAATRLKQIAARQSSSTWALSQTSAPRVDAKSGDGSHFIEAMGEVMSPEVKTLQHRLIEGIVERKDTQSKVKRRPGDKPAMRDVEIDAMRPLMEKVKAFAGWERSDSEEEVSVCVSIQSKDGGAVQHFLLAPGCQPDFAGLANNDRIPVVELILKDKEGNRLPIHRGDMQTPWGEMSTNILIEKSDRWYFATPRFLVSSHMTRPGWLVSSPAITFRFEFDLDQQVAVRLATSEAQLVPGSHDFGPPSRPPTPPPPRDSAPQLPNATPPGLSPPTVPQIPSGPRAPRMPGPPPAIPRAGLDAD